MALRLRLIFACTFLFFGIALFLLSWLYFPSTDALAVNIPTTLSLGHLTADFRAGYSVRYQIAVEFDEPAKIRYDRHDCITAKGSPPNECDGIPSGFNGTWELTSNDRLIKSGTIPTTMWQLSRPFSLALCDFEAQRSMPYKLELNISTDGTRLAAAKPRLQIYVLRDKFFLTEIPTKLERLALLLVATFCMLIGFLLLAIWFWDWKLDKKLSSPLTN
jgi:hypothetical protein